MLLKIGELAKRSGLTIRTLHHYDQIGLLQPSARSEADYRLYDRDDVARLHRIQALRRLDLSLAEIAGLMQGDGADLLSVITQQVAGLEQQIAHSMELRERLQELAGLLRQQHEPNLEYWLSTLEMMSVRDKYFSKEEIALLRQKKSQRGEQMEMAMQPIVAAVRALMDQGVPATDPRALELTRQWMSTVQQALPDPRLLKKISAMHRDEPALQAMSGVDGAMMDYITLASVEIRYRIYRKHLSEAECRFFRASFVKNASAWNTVFAELKQAMENGVAATDAPAQTILRQWRAMFLEAWGHQLEIVPKVRAIHEQEPELGLGGGLTPDLLIYARQGLRYLETQPTA